MKAPILGSLVLITIYLLFKVREEKRALPRPDAGRRGEHQLGIHLYKMFDLFLMRDTAFWAKKQLAEGLLVPRPPLLT